MKPGDYLKLVGTIFWVLSSERFPPETDFRCLAKFTSDFSPSFTVVVNYSSELINGGNKVNLYFAFLGLEEARPIIRHTEILLLDGWKVLAVCKDLHVE